MSGDGSSFRGLWLEVLIGPFLDMKLKRQLKTLHTMNASTHLRLVEEGSAA